MARVISLLLCLALLASVAFVNASGRKKQKGYGYQAPQKVIILPAGPSVTYPWVGHCPPKGKCKHIPYVKRPPFPSFLPPAPQLPYYAPTQYVPAQHYSQGVAIPPAPAYTPSAPVYSQPDPIYAQPAPSYAQAAPDYSQSQAAPDYSQSQAAPDYSQSQAAPDYSQAAPTGFAPSQPIYSAPEPVAAEPQYNIAPAAAAVDPTPYSPAPQEYSPPVPQEFSVPSQPEYSAPAPAIQEYAPPAQQEYSAPTQQEYSPPAQQEYAAPAPQEYVPSAPQEYAPPAPQEYAPPAPQEYAPPAQQEYSAPSGVQEFAAPTEYATAAAPAVDEFRAPQSVDISQLSYPDPEFQQNGEVSIIPAYPTYEAPDAPLANEAGYAELGVEQQTAPSWGPVSGPYGETIGASNSAEIQTYQSAINEAASSAVAETPGNEQSYPSSGEVQPEAVQVADQPIYSQPTWETFQQIDSVQPEGTSAPDAYDIQGQYTQEEPVQQQDTIQQGNVYETETFQSDLAIQQAAEAGEYSENNNYGSRIRPRGAQQRRSQI